MILQVHQVILMLMKGELKNLSAHYKNLKVINWYVKEVVNASATDVWLVVELKEKL